MLTPFLLYVQCMANRKIAITNALHKRRILDTENIESAYSFLSYIITV